MTRSKRGRAARLWALLIVPPSPVTDPAERRRVRHLTPLIVVYTLLLFLGVLARLQLGGVLGPEMVVAVPSLVVAHWLSRTRFIALSTCLAAGAMTVTPLYYAWEASSSSPDTAWHGLLWVSLPVFFTSFVLDSWRTAAVTAVLIGAAAALVLCLPAPLRPDLVVALSVVVVAGALSIGSAAVHERDRRDIIRELSERERVEAELREAKGGLEARVSERTTELNLAQDRLRKSEKLEAIGQLAGGVAHDFNNLLTVIRGVVDVAIEEVEEGHILKDDLETIREASDRAAVLTRQLLAFGGRQVLRPQPLDLNEVISGMGTMLRRLLSEDVTLEIRPGADLGLVEADPGQIEQVILNLVVNAGDAMPKGGTLTLEAKNALGPFAQFGDLPPSFDGPAVMLSVGDSGEGMPAEVKERVFEPFFTTKEGGRGTGLGLATVYGIVNQSGGVIDVESELDVGTTFRILLPRIEGVTSVDDIEERGAPTGSETILLVEDEPSVRGLASRMLTRLGYSVLTAGDGLEALEVYDGAAESIDLVLTDVIMPRMGGPACVEALQKRRPGLPVVYMSGHTDRALDDRGVLDDKLVLVQKPFGLLQLAGPIRAVLDERG